MSKLKEQMDAEAKAVFQRYEWGLIDYDKAYDQLCEIGFDRDDAANMLEAADMSR